MPSSIGHYRSHVGQHHKHLGKNQLNCTEQQSIISDLVLNPDAALKQVKAESMLHVILLVSNILQNINCNVTSARPHNLGMKNYDDRLLSHSNVNTGHKRYQYITSNNKIIEPVSLPATPQRVRHRIRSIRSINTSSIITHPINAPSNNAPSNNASSTHTLSIIAPSHNATIRSNPKKTVKSTTFKQPNPIRHRQQKSRSAARHKQQKKQLVNYLDDQNLFALKDRNNRYLLINTIVDYLGHPLGGLAGIVRQLLKPSGDFGAHKNEILSRDAQYRIFNHWLEYELFQHGLDEFVARQLDETLLASTSNETVSLSAHLYRSFLTQLDAAKTFSRAKKTVTQTLSQAAKDFIIDELILPRLPALRFQEKDADFGTVVPGSIEWGYLHAGLLFARSLDLDSDMFNESEAIELGRSMEALMRIDAIPPEQVIFFDLPAKLYLVKNSIDAKQKITIKSVFTTRRWDKKALREFFKENERLTLSNDPFHLLQTAFEQYKTRTILAEEGAEHANAAFKKQNENIGNKYAVVDELLLENIISSLPEGEYEFIAMAEVSAITAVFSAFDTIHNQKAARVIPRNAYTVDLKPTVDLLSAKLNDATRIYAFEQTSQGYQLQRIDKQLVNYYPLMIDEQKCRTDEDYKLKIYDSSSHTSPIKNGNQGLDVLITALVKKHRENLVSQLHEHGYEETVSEKVLEFLLSMVPFYDCITGSIEGKPQAVPACIMDAGFLLPVIGQTSVLSLRLAQKGAVGGMMAYRQTMGVIAARAGMREVLKAGGKNLIRYAVVPAAQELSSDALVQLGISLIRGVDPGAELLVRQGYRLTASLTKIVKSIPNRMPVWNKCLPRLEQRLSGNIDTPWLESLHKAKLAGTDVEVSALKIGVNGKNRGQDIYVLVNFGEISGKKYTLSADNILTAVPVPLAKRMKIILVAGLSGRGAPRAARQFAADDATGVADNRNRDISLLLTRWVENQSTTNPLGLREFIIHSGRTQRRFRAYVTENHVLSPSGEILLQRSGFEVWSHFFDLPYSSKLNIINAMDVNILHKLRLAFNTNHREHHLQMILYAVNFRLHELKAFYLASWNQWAMAGSYNENRWRAVAKLLRCFDSGQQQLDLSSLSLSELPALLPNWLHELNVRGNQLSELPLNLPDGLEDLDISRNLFERLPVTLPASLMIIKAAQNQLIRLPERLPEMLEKLNVAENQLTQLPAQLPNGLKELDASVNRVAVLPANLPDSLLTLIMVKNRLAVLPDNLPINLLYIDVSYNFLNSLPASMPTKLRHLFADENRIEYLPENLPNRLRQLKVANNKLQRLPQSLPDKLTYLFVANNRLHELPATLPPRLKYLSVSDNHLGNLPDSLPPVLRFLFLTGNVLTVLPESLPNRLEIIVVDNNHLNRLPTNFPPNLKKLDVSRNFIYSRPYSLQANVLFINHNPIVLYK